MEFIWFYFIVFSVVFWWMWYKLCKATERNAWDDLYEPPVGDLNGSAWVNRTGNRNFRREPD